jgi:uncharacterized protein
MSISLSLEAIFLCYKNKELPEFVCLEVNDVNQRGNFGNTPLHVACSRGILEEIEGLLDAGADVNARGELDDIPLHDAALAGHLPVVKLLLQKGADPDLVNKHGSTPRDFAVSLKHDNIASVLDAWGNTKGQKK